MWRLAEPDVLVDVTGLCVLDRDRPAMDLDAKSRTQPSVASLGDCNPKILCRTASISVGKNGLCITAVAPSLNASRSRAALYSAEIITTFACGFACISLARVA